MPLTQTQTDELKALLSGQRATLAADVDSHKTHRSDGATHLRTHRDETDDDAVVESMDAMEISGLARAGAELERVNAALERLTNGRYGRCIKCGVDIGLARLKVAPEVALCLTCQAQAESRR